MITGRPRKIEMVGTDKAKCSKCFVVKPLSEFYTTMHKTYYAHCNTCHMALTRKIRNRSVESQFRYRMSSIKSRCKKTNQPMNITAGHLIDLWDRQRGLCFYTDIALTIGGDVGKRPSNGASIDKIDPQKGYIIGNVVIAAERVNKIKHDISLREMREWMPGWYNRIERFLGS